MDIALQGASRAEDLIPIDDPRSHYHFAKIFEAKGWGAKGRNKERLKLLQNLDPALSDLLHDGERVVAVTWGQEYSFFESYFLGVWALLLNRRALLLTPERLLLFQISSRRKLLALKAQVRFGAIQKIAGSWLGHLSLKLASKKTVLLTQIPRAMRKPFRATLESLRSQSHVSNASGREHLCPHCWEPIAEIVPLCPKCRGTFKSASRARWLSLVFPGLGDLYLGHKLLGVFQLSVAAAYWAGVGIGLGASMAEAGPDDPGVNVAATAVVFALMLVMLHGVDALVTGHTAKKGLYPEKRGATSR